MRLLRVVVGFLAWRVGVSDGSTVVAGAVG